MTDKSIYPYTFAHARDSGEQEAFWKSNQRNQECATAIDKAIAESRYDQHFYKLPTALDTVRHEFGMERVAWVVADTVQHYDYDGRFSCANKDWALHFPIPQDRESHVVLNTHLSILDGFADKVRGTRLHELAQTVGTYEKRHHMAEHNRLTWFHSDLGSFIPNHGVTEWKLAERCAEIAEKQSPIAAVEMSTEQNYNQIDGLRNNMAVPPPDLTDGQTHEELQALAPETLPEAKSSVLGKIKEAQAVPCAHSTPKATKCKEELER